MLDVGTARRPLPPGLRPPEGRVDADVAARRRLAASLRRLSELAVTSAATESTLVSAAELAERAERSVGALTGRLEVRYRKPTRLHRTIRYEAVLDEAAGRLAHVRVRALDGDEETAEAKLAFVELDPTHFEALVAAVPAPRP